MSADVLAENLEVSPGALRTTISRLRRLLGFTALVSGVPPGYQLDADAVDAREFEEYLAVAAATDDAAEARRLLENGISLWRGDAYSEFAHEQWASVESRRLAELRAGAVEILAGLMLDSGDWSGAIATLEPFIAANPFRDRPRGLLMRAMADSGRRVDALRAFQDYRKLLIDEVGTEPSPELVNLDRAIARQSDSKAPMQRASLRGTDSATILVTRIVDYTRLASRLSSDVVAELRRQHFSILRQEVSLTGGSEVKNMENGLMVAFSSLCRALACAVAMQQAFERHNRRSEQPIAIRVGISIGDSTEDDRGYFRDPVVEASRLCDYAEGEQILTTAMALELAGHDAMQEFVALGEVALNGLRDPVEVVEVRWAPDVDAIGESAKLPIPARLAATSAESLFTFFGRTAELRTLEVLHKRSATEHRLGIVLISGEPGVGKTSLVAEAARAVHLGGATALYGAGDEDLAVPFKPWVEALTPLVHGLAGEVLRRFSESNGLTLARLVPEFARRLGEQAPSPAAESDAERFMVMESVVRLLKTASEETPLFVVLDDLHWADAASLQLFGQLAHSSLPMAVTVVGTFRDTDLSRTHPLTPLLARLHREPAVQRLALVGLEDFEMIGLMEAAAGHALPDEGVALAHALRRETGGNPFFVVEMLLHLAQEGTFVQDHDGIWRLTVELDAIGLPTSVREVVAQRVANLGEETERALSMASVIGRDFNLSALSAALEQDELELSDLLEGATTANLLQEAGDDGYRFVHALIQHTLYQNLSAVRRRRAHLRVAEVLEDAGGDEADRLAALARHWLAASAQTDGTKAAYYARRAGQVALAAYAPTDAVAWFLQALEVLDRHVAPEAERGRLLVELSIAQNHAGIPEHRQTLLDAAEIALRLGDADLLMEAALGGRRGFGGMTETDLDRAAIFQAALSELDQREPSHRALLLASLAEVTDSRDWRLRRELADEAVALADELDDSAKLDVILSCYQFRAQPERSAERLAETAWACQTADLLGDPVLGHLARFQRIHACMEVADLLEVDRRIEEMGPLVERTGLPYYRWQLLLIRTWRAVLAGDLATGERLNDEALAVGSDIGAPEALGVWGAVLFDLRVQQGRVEELIDAFAQTAAENPAIPVLRVALAAGYCLTGRAKEATALVEQDVSTGFTEMPRDLTWTTAMVWAQESAVALRHHEAAEILYGILDPFGDIAVFNNGTCYGSVARCLGRLAHFLEKPDAAQSHFRTALSINERLNAPYWIARTLLDYADLLCDVGKADEAIGLVDRAIEIAKTFGFSGLENRANTSPT